MDQRERINDAQEALLAALDGRQAAIWTSLPGVVQSFDATAQTAVVQPAVQALAQASDGSTALVTLPLLLDCPVQFPSGGGATLAFPVTEGDECLVVFASRCIDAWWQSGGVQPQAEARMHDLSDGFVLLGVRSKPRMLASISTSEVQLRSDDGSTSIAMNPTTQTLHLKAPGGVTIDANVQVNGAVTATGEGTFNGGHTVSQHTHTQPADSHGDTEQPTNKPTG